MRKNYILLKTISLILVFSFSFCNVSIAAVEKPEEAQAVAEAKGKITVEDIGIAIDSGTVKNKYKGRSDKVIVHIQDAHCNYEAQSNINRILNQLWQDYGVKMISVEGAEGIVDTTWFKAFPDAEIRKEVADYFMKKGEITGAEFFSINTDYDGTIYGAEEREYYVKNLKAFTSVYPYKNVIENYFLNLRTIASRLKSTIYPPKLKELDRMVRDFDEKEVELSNFSEYLYKNAKKYRVSVDDLVDFKKLVDTLDYEKKIDFDIVDQERSNYIDALSKKLSKEKMADLVAQSIRFKKGQIKSVEFYSYLRDLAKEYNIPIVREYPNLFYYYLYTKLYDTIDNENLFKEINVITARLKDKFFTDSMQKKLDKYSNAVDLYIDLLNIEMTNDDYGVFQGYKKEFTLDDMVVFFDGLSARYGMKYSLGSVPVQVSENLPDMVDFYEVAMKRDKVLVENTLKQMDREGTDICVMIAGGFHTKGFENILERKSVSYLVVTPKITKDVETPYIKVLTNQRTSLEDIITESAAMPGMKTGAAAREEAMLSPLLKVAYNIKLFLEDRTDLERLSKMVGEIEGVTLMASTEATFKEIVDRLVFAWLAKVKGRLQADLGKEGTAEWNGFLTEPLKWDLLVRAYIHNLYKARMILPGFLSHKAMYAIIGVLGRAFAAFREEELGALALEAERLEARRPEEAVEPTAAISPVVRDRVEVVEARRPEEPTAVIPQAISGQIAKKGPVYLLPAAAAREVGVPERRLAAYWVGSRGPAESSIVEAAGARVSLNEILTSPDSETVESFLGTRVVPTFGRKFPVFGALTSQTMMPERFDTKDKQWIVTGIDKTLAGGERGEILLGFNPTVIEDYRTPTGAIDRKAFMRDYLEALKTGVNIERFRYYREVEEGDVVFIPAGMLHALGPGVQVVESEIAGSEQHVIGSLNFFQGVPSVVPERERTVTEGVRIEAQERRFPKVQEVKTAEDVEKEPSFGRFGRAGVEVRNIVLEGGARLALPTAGSYHVLAIAGEGEAELHIGGEIISIPNIASGERLPVVPANAEEYTIVSKETPGKAPLNIVDIFTPEPRDSLPVPIREGERIAGTDVPESLEEVVMVTHKDGEMDTYDILHILGAAAYRPQAEKIHPHVLTVMEGRVRIEIFGEEPEKIDLGPGAIFPMPENVEYEITGLSEEPAAVRIDYEKDRAESIFYAGFEMLKKRMQEISQKGPVTLVMPSEMFVGGGRNMPGSRKWWQKMFRAYVNPQITIELYWSEERPKVKETGLDAAMKAVDASAPEATKILVATQSKIGTASEPNQEKMKSIRMLAIPDIDEAAGLKNKGWFFARETIGAALLLSIVDPKNVFFGEGMDTPASDLQKFMGQALGRHVDRRDLCFMLSYVEVEEEISRSRGRWTSEDQTPKWFKDIREIFEKEGGGITAWLLFLVKKALLNMPIEPYDTNKHLRERQENIFKAIRAV